MLLSSGVVWRHVGRDVPRGVPAGDASLQRLLWERLDDALAWLESLGAEPVRSETGNPLTIGRRFDPRSLTSLLALDVELSTPLPVSPSPDEPLVLATGGFGKRLAAERGLLLRANPWSDGAGLDHGLARGAAVTAGMEEFYGRALPAPPAMIDESAFVALAQLYGGWARVYTDGGREITPAASRGRRTTSRS